MKMHKIKYNIAALLLLLQVGCQTHKMCSPGDKDYPYVVPEIPMASPIPVQNEANVRLPEVVKAYSINRYQDPNNPDIMHERHVIYRREQDSNWRLLSNADRQILVGPTMTDGRLDNQPAIMEKEFAIELQRQRQMNEAQKQITNEILQQQGSLVQLIVALNNKIEGLLEREKKEQRDL